MVRFLDKLFLATILIAGFLAVAELKAADPLYIQTLTYDSITTRRGTWTFPDNPQDYRKILMYYSLKCDPRTTQDKYNCGEWDYLTYNIVYQHTGEKDSTKYQIPFYKIGGRSTPDTIYLSNQPCVNKYVKRYINSKITNVDNETQFVAGASDKQLSFGSAGRIQFLLTKDELVALGMQKGDIVRLKIPLTTNSNFKEFTLKLKKSLLKSLTQMDEGDMTEYYRGPVDKPADNAITIDLKTPFTWSGTSAILFEISYTLEDPNGTVTFSGSESTTSVFAQTGDKNLRFDGSGDWVDCGSLPEMENASSFTIEGWVNINTWKNWGNVFGKGNNTTFQLGGSSGDIYCILRTASTNTYGYVTGAIALNKWYHLAMTFDGSKSTNEERLRLYINGAKVTMTFNGTIPATTMKEDQPFGLTGVSHNSADINGSLDEIRVWKTALDESTIAGWMNKSVTSGHPDYSDLLLYYPLDDVSGNKVKNAVAGRTDGILLGVPTLQNAVGDGLTRNISTGLFKPGVTLSQGTAQSTPDTTDVNYEEQKPQVSVETFEIVNRVPVRKDLSYSYLAGYSYTYDASGAVKDSSYNAPTQTLYNHKIEYYGEPFEKITEFEIGRYITPYGIGLDLGPDGFTWVYDVTDYAPLLKGQVDFSAGNQQELIDVKFAFIPGESPRDVVGIKQPWGPMKSYSYASLSSDASLSKITVGLDTDASTYKVITRLTGHGHNSNDGNYPHCCEWKDNVHSLMSDNATIGSWHIFQYDDCALNPVYPQGGTWPGSREGWCPGDVVKDNEYEVTGYVKNHQINLDYDITKVPTDNQGMGGGNYVVCMHLIEYGDIKHDNDAEVYDVITPNKWDYYSRRNPICSEPTVIVRNNGKQALTSLSFEYGVSGGNVETYNWTGSIPSMEKDTIVLPIDDILFWTGDSEKKFTVKTLNPNGKTDENNTNDSYTTEFNLPDFYADDIVIVCQNNSRENGEGYYYYVTDWDGNKVVNHPNLTPNKLYKDTINFKRGCYTLTFVDQYNMGLSYWAYTAQGNGSLKIQDKSGKTLKTFDPDFGHGITYSFDLRGFLDVQEPNEDMQIVVFPNPTSEYVNFETGYLQGDVHFTITDITGKVVMEKVLTVEPDTKIPIAVGSLTSGTYLVSIKCKDKTINRKFLKN